MGESPDHEHLLAENSAMKRRLPLVERENDVLQKENHIFRTKVHQMEADIQELTNQLAQMNDRYENDISENKRQITYLEESMRQLDVQRIDEISTLESRMAAQREFFNLEREQIKSDRDKRELALTGQLSDLEKKLGGKESEIASLASANMEMRKDLTSKENENAALISANDEMKAASEKKSAEITALVKTNEDLSEKLERKTELARSLRKARDESVAELESVKAASNDLVKNLKELFHQMTSNSDQHQTKI